MKHGNWGMGMGMGGRERGGWHHLTVLWHLMLRCNLLSYLIHGMARWCGLGDIYIYINSIHWLSFCTWYCALTCATPGLQLVLLFNFLLQLMLLQCSFLCCASMIRPALRFNLRHAITCAMPLCFNFLLHVIWRFTLRNCPWGWAISVVITAHLGLDASVDIGTCRKCWAKYVRRDGLWMFVDHMMPCKGVMQVSKDTPNIIWGLKRKRNI